MKETQDKTFTSDVLTHGIRVQAEAFFLNTSQTDFQELNTFSYKITFSNEGDTPAQLVSRHWIIIDSNGKRQEVNGPGVVGQYPRLAPGESYSYNSYSQLPTNWGTMEGEYLFSREDGETFEAVIGRFYLIKEEE